jgi:phosphoglycolate phosphatase-like HAD superfamily hydrolase
MEYYHKLLAEYIIKDLPGKKIFAGVNPLLEVLERNVKLKTGVLTGNWKKAAYIKLSHFRLDKYFGFGAFGDDAVIRNDLLQYALKRCNGCLDLDTKNVIIIGDTPSDMKCAVSNGCRSLGVATGRFSAQELVRSGADSAVEDLTNTEEITAWILNKTK